MELVIEATCVAHGLAVIVPPPQGGGGGLAVGAHRAFSSRSGLK